ncbi:hypothetical protein [Mucilaginibacter rubeus]|uniref:hypothetical protein n=1 Tax=Mucilaginibacter rubeus TaxID=2027860 RepID=UPI001668D36E|nr:hypothetical protein [Mucilaginibacter rubeus]
MFNLFLAIFMAFACPKHNNQNHNTTAVNATATNDTGGDKGHFPPPPPPPGS